MKRNQNNKLTMSDASIQSISSSQYSVTNKSLYIGKERKAQLRLSFKIFKEMLEQEQSNQTSKLAMKFPQIQVILTIDKLMTLLTNYQFKMNLKGQLALFKFSYQSKQVSYKKSPRQVTYFNDKQMQQQKLKNLSINKIKSQLQISVFRKYVECFSQLKIQTKTQPLLSLPQMGQIDGIENLIFFTKKRKQLFLDGLKNTIRKGNAIRRIGVIASKNHQISKLIAFKRFTDIKLNVMPSFIEPDNNNHELQELNTNSLFSLKERVAIKFAATTMITNFFSQRVQQKMFQFFFSYQQMLCWHQQNLCLQQQQYIENLEAQFQGEGEEQEQEEQQIQDSQLEEEVEENEQIEQQKSVFDQSFQNLENERQEKVSQLSSQSQEQKEQESLIEIQNPLVDERQLPMEQLEEEELQKQLLMEQVVKQKILATNQLLYTMEKIYQQYFELIKQNQTFRQYSPQASGFISPLLSPPSKTKLTMNNIKKLQFQNASDQESVTYLQSMDRKNSGQFLSNKHSNGVNQEQQVEEKAQNRESMKHLVEKAQQIKSIQYKEQEENIIVKLVLTFILILLCGGIIGYSLI